MFCSATVSSAKTDSRRSVAAESRRDDDIRARRSGLWGARWPLDPRGSVEIEDTDLEQCSVGRWPDVHGQVLAHVTPAQRTTYRVLDVVVGHAMVPGRLRDPPLDRCACLSRQSKPQPPVADPLLARRPRPEHPATATKSSGSGGRSAGSPPTARCSPSDAAMWTSSARSARVPETRASPASAADRSVLPSSRGPGPWQGRSPSIGTPTSATSAMPPTPEPAEWHACGTSPPVRRTHQHQKARLRPLNGTFTESCRVVALRTRTGCGAISESWSGSSDAIARVRRFPGSGDLPCASGPGRRRKVLQLVDPVRYRAAEDSRVPRHADRDALAHLLRTVAGRTGRPWREAGEPPTGWSAHDDDGGPDELVQGAALLHAASVEARVDAVEHRDGGELQAHGPGRPRSARRCR